MKKVAKKKLQADHNKLLNQFADLVRDLKSSKVISEETCPTFYRRTTEIVDDICEQAEPKPKQLTQSVFNGLDEKWRFAAVCGSGKAIAAKDRPETLTFGYFVEDGYLLIGTGYDTTNWKNSLIERDLAKELLEVDLSSELTGSDLARAMLANASKPIMCAVSDISTSKAMSLGSYDLIHDYTDEHSFMSLNQTWVYATPINNQGEPLTASEVGL